LPKKKRKKKEMENFLFAAEPPEMMTKYKKKLEGVFFFIYDSCPKAIKYVI